VIDGAMASLTAIMMFVYRPSLGLVALAALVVYLLIRIAFFRLARRRSLELIEAKSRESTIFIETMRAVQSIKIFTRARDHAESRGILLADTKFEFGLKDGGLLWIDEALTPDSSRFWPRDRYAPGRSQPSFDKQYVRDYLESLQWDKRPPGPVLPEDVVARTLAKYKEAYALLAGPRG